MNVALIDVDLPRNGKVKFPTLTLMKISAYYKKRYKAGVVCKNRESILALAVKMLDVAKER